MSSPLFSVNVQQVQVDDVFAPSCVTSPTSSTVRLTPASGLPPASPKRNRPIEFDDDEELRRPPSLYVHNPYGPGQMLRLKPFHEIMAEMNAAVNAAAASMASSAATAAAAAQQQQPTQPQESNKSDVVNSENAVKTITNTNQNTDEETRECEDDNAESQEEDSGSPLTCSSQRQQGQNGKRRRRQKKPRKNRSASLESETGERVSVCLDYLKGVCNRKRSRCKFAHPPLSFTASSAPSTPCSCPSTPVPCACPPPTIMQPIPVCAGYAMMGYCNYGTMCPEAHPQAHLPYQSTGVPIYPTSWPMPNDNSRAAARRVSEASNTSMWSEGSSLSEENCYRTPSPLSFGRANDEQHVMAQQPMSCPPTFLRAWRDVNAWLAGTCFQNFDYTLAHVFNVLYDPTSGLTLERLLPAIFGKAIDNYERLARVLAALCERLCALLTEEQQQEFKTQMSRLAATVLAYAPEPTDSDERIVNMARKLRGTAVFVGELFLQGLMTGPSLQNHLEFIIQRAAEPSDIGALFTELGCLILNVCGHMASKVLHMDQAVKNLNASVAFHQSQQRRGSMPHAGGVMGMNNNSMSY